MGSLNKAMIIGRLGADPEVSYTQNDTARAVMRVATNDRYKDSNGEWIETTEWHRVIAWARLAEVCQQYLKKGSLVYFEGPIQTRSWEDKEGQKQYMTEIKALGMQMLDSRDSDKKADSDPSGRFSDEPESRGEPVTDDGNEEELPF